MAFSEIELHRIKKEVGGFCSKRSPAHLKDQLRYDYEVDKQSVIIYEIRPMWENPQKHTKAPVAKLTYVIGRKIWKLFWQRANMKWVAYEPGQSAPDLNTLVKEIDADRYGCFFG